MIKVLHAADFHLDAPFAALLPSLAGQRRREQRNALQQLAKACEGCEIVLLAGDLFDGRQVYRDTLDALQACFASISAQIFISPGNHDSICTTSPYLTEKWGENVHIFTKPTVERVELEGCHVYGAAYTTQGQEVLRDFHVADPSVVNLMVLHSGGSYNPSQKIKLPPRDWIIWHSVMFIPNRSTAQAAPSLPIPAVSWDGALTNVGRRGFCG